MMQCNQRNIRLKKPLRISQKGSSLLEMLVSIAVASLLLTFIFQCFIFEGHMRKKIEGLIHIQINSIIIKRLINKPLFIRQDKTHPQTKTLYMKVPGKRSVSVFSGIKELLYQKNGNVNIVLTDIHDSIEKSFTLHEVSK